MDNLNINPNSRRSNHSLTGDASQARRQNIPRPPKPLENDAPLILVDAPSLLYVESINELEEDNSCSKASKGCLLAPGAFTEECDDSDEDDLHEKHIRDSLSGFVSSRKDRTADDKKDSKAKDTKERERAQELGFNLPEKDLGPNSSKPPGERNFKTLKQTAQKVTNHNTAMHIIKDWMVSHENPERLFINCHQNALKVGIPPGVDVACHEEILNILDKTYHSYSKHYPKNHRLVQNTRSRYNLVKNRIKNMTVPAKGLDMDRLFKMFRKKSIPRLTALSFDGGPRATNISGTSGAAAGRESQAHSLKAADRQRSQSRLQSSAMKLHREKAKVKTEVNGDVDKKPSASVFGSQTQIRIANKKCK